VYCKPSRVNLQSGRGSHSLVRPQQPAVRPRDDLTGGVQDPSASIVCFRFSCFICFFLSQALFSFCRVVAHFLRRVVQVLDRPVASSGSSTPLVARAGRSSRYPSPSPSRGGGAPAGARLELVPSREHTSGPGGISAHNLGRSELFLVATLRGPIVRAVVGLFFLKRPFFRAFCDSMKKTLVYFVGPARLRGS